MLCRGPRNTQITNDAGHFTGEDAVGKALNLQYPRAIICVQVIAFDKRTGLHKVFGLWEDKPFQDDIDLHSMVKDRVAEFVNTDVLLSTQTPTTERPRRRHPKQAPESVAESLKKHRHQKTKLPARRNGR